MGETAKAYPRRVREGWFEKYVQDPGIDIGCQRDPLNHTFRRWDVIFGDGDATLMDGVPDETFATVYASHVLEHLDDPVSAIRNWWRILAPGGHLIVVVPHRDLYEGKTELPSRWNHEHKIFWIPHGSLPPHTLGLFQVLGEAIGVNTARSSLVGEVRVCDEGWAMEPGRHAVGEYSIEAILRKEAADATRS
jgi:SAM-dependent methyltransferase